jgi:hypothetical protein
LLVKDWSDDKYFHTQEKTLELPKDFKDNIERVNINDLTLEEFLEKYERGDKPVIITGVAENWKAKD